MAEIDQTDHVGTNSFTPSAPITTERTMYYKMQIGAYGSGRTGKIAFKPTATKAQVDGLAVSLAPLTQAYVSEITETFTINTAAKDVSTQARGDKQIYVATYDCIRGTKRYQKKVSWPYPKDNKAAFDAIFQLEATIALLDLDGATSASFVESHIQRMN